METSILKTTKKLLNIDVNYTAFDLDILTHINSTFSVLEDLGVGPVGGFVVEDDSANWDDLALPSNQLQEVKAYIYVKARKAFDPPTTSFAIEALNSQIAEHEWRLNVRREVVLHPATVEEEEVED